MSARVGTLVIPKKKGTAMNDVRETIAELDELIKSGDFGEREVELFKKLRGAARRA